MEIPAPQELGTESVRQTKAAMKDPLAEEGGRAEVIDTVQYGTLIPFILRKKTQLHKITKSQLCFA